VIDSAPLLHRRRRRCRRRSERESHRYPGSVTPVALSVLSLETDGSQKGTAADASVTPRPASTEAGAEHGICDRRRFTTHIGGIGELVGTRRSPSGVKILSSGLLGRIRPHIGRYGHLQHSFRRQRVHGSLSNTTGTTCWRRQNWATTRVEPRGHVLNFIIRSQPGRPGAGFKKKLFFFGAWESQIDRSPNNKVAPFRPRRFATATSRRSRSS